MNIKKIAVIGSNSFSGSFFIKHILVNTNWNIIGTSRSAEPSDTFLPYRATKESTKRFKFYQLDSNDDFDRLTKLLDKEKPEVIVNFAAQSNVPFSWKHPEQWFTTNCMGIIKLADHLRASKYLKKYIQISTPEVYGSCKNLKEIGSYFNPTTPYAASKAAGDLYLNVLYKNFNFPVIFIRSANVYGPHQQLYRIIPNATITLKKTGIFLMRAPNIRRNFVHMEDVSRGIVQAIKVGKIGEVYHFSAGDNITMKQVVELISKKIGLKPKEAIKIGKVGEIRDDIYQLNYAKTSKDLNWKPQITLTQGIDQVLTWLDANWSELKQYSTEYTHKK